MPNLSRRELLLGAAIVKAKRKPADEWQEYPTRTVAELPGFTPGRKFRLSRYGGLADRKGKATGFFRAEQVNGRWWFRDPDGCLYLNLAVTSVSPGSSPRMKQAMATKFGEPEKWAAGTVKLLRANGFNATGAWANNKLLRAAPDALPYANMMGFAATFGREKKLTLRQPGHTGFLNDALPVFHPEFESWCDQYAKSVADTKDDPLLMGHFCDNEMPGPKNLLDKSLDSEPAAKEWLRKRRGALVPVSDLNDEDRDGYREYVYDRYLGITSRAIRKYDPNHLCFGSRLWGAPSSSPGILRACGRHLDVIAANIYGQWQPKPEQLEMWRKESGKPFLVTEFYAKGMDSGLPNTTGAGWLVATQTDRARFYQNFTLALLESKMFAGWQWFKYQDNDPEDKNAEPSNIDSNKGIVDYRFEPYAPLLAGMAELNREAYALTEYFDRK